MRKFLVFFVVFNISYACTDRDDDLNGVNIRIKNNTEAAFTEVRVVANDTVYENIPAGEYSDYIAFVRAFEAAELSIVTDSITYNYLPTAVFVDSLPIGFYTYELEFNEAQQIDLTFRIEN